MLRWTPALIAVAALATPLQAQDSVECTQNTYTEAQKQKIAEILPRFTGDVAAEEAANIELGDSAGGVVDICAQEHGWTAEEKELAAVFEFSRLREVAFRQHGPMPAQDIAKLDAALAKGDRTALWQAMENQVLVGYTGEPSPTEQQDITILGAFLIGLGYAFQNDKNEQFGMLMGFMALQRYGKREFAALQ